jgi:predicted metal-dependent HD superfamily phosphohydrolase
MEYFNLARWRNLVERASLPSPVDAGYQDLRRRYSEPQRYYHTAQHIDECLREFDSLRVNPSNPVALELAIWFHDAIYDPHATDNEEQSALLAHLSLKDAVPPLGPLVSSLVLATKHHLSGDTPEADLLIDIDLSILGKPPESFAAYESAIRREYSWVPLNLYREKRAAVLRSFLERPRIFATSSFYDLYETSARGNLARSIQVLEQSA